MSELMNALTGLLAEIGYLILAISAVGFVLIILSALQSFKHFPPTEKPPMATGTVTKIIWKNQFQRGEVRDHQTQELIPVPWTAVNEQRLKEYLPLHPGAKVQYDIFFNPSKIAINIRPLE